jgi:hypothetical protein
VTARFFRRDARVGEDAQRGLGVLELDEVVLHVLARRDVALAAAESFGDLGERFELCRRGDAAGDLRADHLKAVLPLAVDAVEQAERSPIVARQLAALECFEALDEQIDIFVPGKAETANGRRCCFSNTHTISNARAVSRA